MKGALFPHSRAAMKWTKVAPRSKVVSRHVFGFAGTVTKYLDEVSAGPLHVERESGSVVIVSEREFEVWNKTFHLLRSPANAERLSDAIKAADAGKLAEQ
jgi:PHD/YefM family antitoxin component YafN of YafNO toxin-antitoxin module